MKRRCHFESKLKKLYPKYIVKKVNDGYEYYITSRNDSTKQIMVAVWTKRDDGIIFDYK